MESSDFFEELMRKIEHLPPDEQVEQMLALIEGALRQMDRPTVLEFRASVMRTAAEREPLSGSVLDLIDGHLALRDMGA